MNQKLQQLLNSIQQLADLSIDEKKALTESVQDVDKEMEITTCELDRTEKIKRTTAILLEETIEELEQKTKAIEATYRELEIESSLERVRTVAMSMMKPDHMLDVCKIISQQLELLKVKEIRNVQTAIFYKEKGTYMNYEYYTKHDKIVVTETNYTNNEIHTAFAAQMMKGAGEFFSTNLNEEEVKEWITYQKTTNVFIDDFLYHATSLNYYWQSLGPVALGISTYAPLEQNDKNLFNRFVKVFQLAYRRYLDIEKAESQAREAQIETSLERVRAQAMAMRTPKDLTGICEMLYAELNSLGFTEIRNAMVNIHNDEKETFVNYDYSDEIGKSINYLTYDIHPLIEKQIKEIRNAEGFSETSFTGKDLEDMITFRKKIGEKDDSRIEKAEALYYYFYSIGTGSIGISTFNVVRGEMLDVLKRFRNVFTLAYQRYTDIAQAEAQTKEAQIEAALERVRSRTMAMHKSEEVMDVAGSLLKELQKLEFAFGASSILIMDKESGDTEYWMAGFSRDKFPESYRLKYFQHPYHDALLKAWKSGEKFLVYTLEGKAKKAYDKVLFTQTGYKNIPAEEQKMMKAIPSVTYSIAFTTHGAIHWGPSPLVEEQDDVLQRFAKIFDQSYTRFLDLQKAEAQAREAQIELGLERVRARAMAMQNSSELAVIVDTVLKELTKLHVLFDRCIIMINDPKTLSSTWWLANPETASAPIGYFVKYHLYKPYLKYITAWKARTAKWEYVLEGNDKKEWDEFVFAETELSHLPAPVIAGMKSFDQIYLNVSFNNFGSLTASSIEPIKDEQFDILLRFAKVFDSTYTRFNDLKQAEAQARESQIQLALERVRARSMAMQKSEELADTAYVLFQQFKELGETPHQITIAIIKEDEGLVEFNITSGDGSGAQVNRTYNFAINEPALIKKLVGAWKENKKSTLIKLAGKDLTDWVAHRSLVSGVTDNTDYTNVRRYVGAAFFTKGLISISTVEPIAIQTIQVLERFAQVFQQTYTRFLDLQKAEAQAKEAKIEAALERVRSRTMAMQKSTELQDTALLLVQQVKALDVPSFACGFNIWDADRKAATSWMAGENRLQPAFKTSSSEDVFFLIHEAAKRGEQLFVAEQGGEVLEAHYRYMASIPAFKAEMDKMAKAGLSVPTFQIIHCAFFLQGYLMFISFAQVPEAHDVFKRFAKVFEQAYTRFLDLQKAEAQAREAKIETGLERVRSRSLAMHHTTELQEVIHTVHKELLHLNLAISGGSFIVINNDIQTALRCWGAGGTADTSEEIILPTYEKPFCTNLINGIKKKGPGFFTENYTRQEKVEFFTFLFKHEPWSNLDLIQQQETLSSPGGYTRSCCVSLHTSIFIINHFGKIFSEDENEILKRFAKVFEQTYTRFLDLQKAEAQGREAHIEAALERVRSRTMAMRKSEELKDVIQVVYEQMVHLNIKIEHTGFVINYKERDDYDIWIADPLGVPSQVIVPYFDSIYYNRFNEAKEKGEDFFTTNLSFSEKNTFYQRLFDYVPGLTEEAKQFYFSCPALAASTVLLENVCLYIENFSGISFTDEENDILMRFGKVFQQTYTRFLDLQKAEAQAREAQIEAALEKVRSRSLAMHKSDELNEVVVVLFEKLKELNIPVTSAGIQIYIEGSKDMNVYVCGQNEAGLVISHYRLPYFDNPITNDLLNVRSKGSDFFIGNYTKEIKNSFYEYLFKHSELKHLPEDIKELILHSRYYTISMAPVKNSMLAINDFEGEILSEKEKEILKRFANVFEQAYTRFFDLQKAEAQSREAKIELALERVRARSMAMQKSHELAQAAQLLYYEFGTLGINTFTCGYLFIKEEKNIQTAWVVLPDGTLLPDFIDFPLTGDHVMDNRYKAWKEKKPLHIYEVQGEVNREHHRFLSKHVPASVVEDIFSRMPDRIIFYCANFSDGYLFIISTEFFSSDEEQTIVRFAKVFEMTYRRFLDLQKAEVQAREAQIELALERVRARTMAMQHSDELQDSSLILFQQLKELGEPAEQCTIGIIKESEAVVEISATLHGNNMQQTFRHKIDEPFVMNKVFRGWKDQQKTLVLELKEEELKKYNQYRNKLVGKETFPEKLLPDDRWIIHAAYFSKGMLALSTNEPRPAESLQLLERFAKVFEQTYTRFLDLQKAEAQARDAKIENALEKARSRTMGMQSSDELPEVANVLFLEIQALGIPAWSCGYNILAEDKKSAKCCMSSEGTLQAPFNLRLFGEASFDEMGEFMRSKKTLLVQELGDKALVQHYAYMKSFADLTSTFEQIDELGLSLPTHQVNHLCKFTQGFLLFITYEKVPDAHEIFKRFTKVFEQTYTRFLDLQNAEAQAREAEIQLALERVRARSLAMHHTSELQDVVKIVAEQLQHMGLNINGGVFITINKELDQDIQLWASLGAADYVQKVVVPFLDRPIFTQLRDAIRMGNNFFDETYCKEEKDEMFQHLFHFSPWKELPTERKEELLSREGGLTRTAEISKYTSIVITNHNGKRFSDKEKDIVKRFGSVFEQSYTRFLDLQKAEAQTKEAQIEAALERVRSRTLAMQKSAELAETAVVLFKQLIMLGIEPNLLYIGIIKNENGEAEFWLTDEDGTEVRSAFEANLNDNPSLKKMFESWMKEMKSLVIDMSGIELKEYFRHLGNLHVPFKDGLAQKRRLQYIAYFNKGFIGMASPEEQPEETMNLLERFAAVFNLTFTRFNDLKIAEAHAIQAGEDLIKLHTEKRRAEDALSELQVTQKQLIQSEKMASLGELTAGIAHEIQNPLNFVNNFSEVSNELIDEMNAEIAKGDFEEAKLIANDIKQNLEKINHHGKRADAIVKGMLQHSRSSSAVKEPTDINKLADEYLRLAYHGLRAKDKTFNASFKSDFDETIGNIHIIPQDIGRVILNLITNAFYAVDEKKRQCQLELVEDYKPTISVSTKHANNQVEISVADNGIGIPKKVLDKIFQPFFTTKPTGQGTGLGLSMSYDIIKAHGGELKVETIEGDGTTFQIQLPIT